MTRSYALICQSLLLLLVLLLVVPHAVAAQESQEKPTPLWVGLMTPDIRSTFCLGQKQEIEFYFAYLYMTKPGVLPPPAPLNRNVVVRITPKLGAVDKPEFRYPDIKLDSVYTGKFTFRAGNKPGTGEIKIEVEMKPFVTTMTISFEVKKCPASVQFNVPTSYSYGPVSVINNYHGGGFLSADANGRISGSGVQAIWGDIPPYSDEGATCTHVPPWEGSSAITFTGQVGENGDITAIMEMDALSVNASTLRCTDTEGGSGGMPFPAYTYSPCQVLLAGFNFEAATLEVPFDCPGESPYIVPITIIPRRGS